jgi:hypothetical protein
MHEIDGVRAQVKHHNIHYSKVIRSSEIALAAFYAMRLSVNYHAFERNPLSLHYSFGKLSTGLLFTISACLSYAKNK